MTCHSPVPAWRLHEPRNGKVVSFKPVPLGWGSAISLPCYKCAGCRLERSRVWAMRCMHEKRMHSASSFVTLTYDNDRLPEFGTLVPDDLKNFHKRLHNRLLRKRGVGIRYYSCGEYGGETCRPHYHCIIFGYEFPDRKFWSERDGHKVYKSAELEEIWGKGSLCEVGDVTMKSAQYVAKYIMKKVDGQAREDGHYLVYNADGVLSERVPEFSRMSLKPGIGAGYIDKYGYEILCHDSVIVEGREVPSIRYYDKLFAQRKWYGPMPYRLTAKTPIDRNKIARQKKSDPAERSPERLAVKAEILRRTLQQKVRKL